MYLAQEQRVFDELNAKVYSRVPAEEQAAPSRYSQDGPFNPHNHAKNWNRTVEMIPEVPTGGVLMLHGTSARSSRTSCRFLSSVIPPAAFSL